jgi:hypothetical protein
VLARQFASWMLIGVGVLLVADRVVESASAKRRRGVRWASSSARRRRRAGVDHRRDPGRHGLPDQRELPGGGLHLQHPAEHRAVGRPLVVRLEREARREVVVWVVLACGITAALGYLATDLTSEAQGGRAAALAAGGLLAMLTNSLMPFAFERGGALAGAVPRRLSASASPCWAAAGR